MLQNKHNWDLTNQLDAKVLKTPARALQQHQFAVCIGVEIPLPWQKPNRKHKWSKTRNTKM